MKSPKVIEKQEGVQTIAHHNTVFSQLHKLVSRHEFETLAIQNHEGHKWIKQNLKIKNLLGTSKNAIMTNSWIAICVYLLLAFLKFASRSAKAFSKFCAYYR